jgi:hypothetical protein
LYKFHKRNTKRKETFFTYCVVSSRVIVQAGPSSVVALVVVSPGTSVITLLRISSSLSRYDGPFVSKTTRIKTQLVRGISGCDYNR